MTRLEGWEARIADTLQTVRGWDYAIGRQDCIAMVCLFVKAVTGADLWPRWAGQYEGLRGALVWIQREADFEQPYLTNAVSRVLGREPIPAKQLQRGDVVEWNEPDGPHLGVVLHAEAVGFGPNGVYFVPVAQCAHGWRVG